LRALTLTTFFSVALAACSGKATAPNDTAGPAETAAPDPDTGEGVAEVGAEIAEEVMAEVAGEVHVARKNTCTAPASAAVPNARVPAGFCAAIWATDLAQPRGLFVTTTGDVLVVERGQGRVTALWDGDGDGLSGAGERAVLASASGLNHGVSVRGGFLYASSATSVRRWPYAGARSDLGAGEVVVRDIPSAGHSTRTLAFDGAGRLYVSCGSASNVDADSRRSRIRRFDVATVPAGGLAFDAGEVFADGLRNEVGLAFDGQDRLWGVQNGIDMLNRDDLGGDIHNDNPAEIVSRFDTPGAFYGYPFCWTEFRLPANVGKGPGTMWAHEQTINDGTHSDAWCQDPTKVDVPELAMQAHSAPLDLEFYNGDSFPEAYRGDLFITFHGSWNRNPPTGYQVVHVDIDASGHLKAPTSFFENAGQSDDGWPHRPVGIRVGRDGQLFVSSDASSSLIVIGHSGE